jgi:hypothetical protein
LAFLCTWKYCARQHAQQHAEGRVVSSCAMLTQHSGVEHSVMQLQGLSRSSHNMSLMCQWHRAGASQKAYQKLT